MIADVDLSAKKISGFKSLTSGTASYYKPSFSPGGEELVCTKAVGGIPQVFVLDAKTGRATQISHTGNYSLDGAWSRDAEELAYATNEDGITKLAVTDVSTGITKVYDSCRVNQFGYEHHTISWAPGKRILYETPGAKSLIAFDPESETSIGIGPATGTEGFRFSPLGSPGGDLFAFLWTRVSRNSETRSDESGQSGMWIATYGGGDAKLAIPLAYPIGWSPDGEWIFAWRIDGRFLCRFSTVTGIVDSLGTVPNAPRLGVTISSDAAKLVYVSKESTSDLWLVENIPAP
jgi:Tol biopolymer transport system component